MKINYFSVFDKKAGSFSQLYAATTPGVAERAFQQTVSDPQSMVSKYPDDYALYQILSLDDESGYVVERFEPPQFVCEARSLVTQAG